MTTPAINIRNLTKYYGKARGVEDISIRVEVGDIFGFIGPNGAGKSTTIRVLLGLIFPTSGSVEVLGMNILDEPKKIRQQLGYIPSDANFYDRMTVREFLEYCIRFYPSVNGNNRIGELCNLFGLDLNRKLLDLSMGNKKKVSIVQSLIHRPKLLILDEPTTGLDPLVQARFFDLLREENRNGMTIFFSSHVLSDIQSTCRTVAIIKDGSIIKTEDVDSLRRKQLKKIRIGFSDEEGMRSFSMEGMESAVTEPSNTISFMYPGSVDGLLHALSGKNISDLTIEEPSLEEIFMHYYK
jgi:ABC-2 type transport system ATP-binding protein